MGIDNWGLKNNTGGDSVPHVRWKFKLLLLHIKLRLIMLEPVWKLGCRCHAELVSASPWITDGHEQILK